MVVPVARRNLLSEKGRLAMSAGGVAVSVLLVLVVLALYRGFSRIGETFEVLPGELWVAQQGTTDPFHSVSLVSDQDIASVAQAPGVAGVVPVLVRQMSFTIGAREGSARLIALDMPSSAMPSDLVERYLPPPGVVIVDQILAQKDGLHEGDAVRFGGQFLTIGPVQPRSTEAFEPFAFVNFVDAQRIFGGEGTVTFGMLFVQPGADATAVSASIEASLPGLQVFTRKEFASAIRKEIDESFLPIISIILAIGFTVGGAVVSLTIYTGVIERSREFGVMKAVGASATFLYRIVLSQSFFVTAFGSVFGLALALVVARLAQQAVPDFATQFRITDIAAVLAGTAVMAAAASLLPVHRINSIDPAMVFKA